MKKIIILGSGKIGSTAAFMLQESSKFQVTIVDNQRQDHHTELEKAGIVVLIENISDANTIDAVLANGYEYVLNACPYHLNIGIIDAVAKKEMHYFDLSEDVKSANYIKEIAKKSKSTFIPQCGLAPGFVSISANHLCNYFDELKDVKLRVGALTLSPNNMLKYNLSWSTDGLLNEYSHPCDAIVNGKFTKVLPLEGLEHFCLEGIEYEAFNTSGGIGGLAEKLNGKVENLDYKTIRYKGHRDLMKFLFDDLGFKNDRPLLTKIFNNNIATTSEDVIIIYISVTGLINGKLEQKTVSHTIPNQMVGNKHFTGIQLTTAGSVCAVIDLHSQGKIAQSGYVMQEDIPYEDYVKSPFLNYYFK